MFEKIRRRTGVAILGFTVALGLAAGASRARPATAGQDHPAVKRYAGATLVSTVETPFERIELYLGPLVFDGKAQRAAPKDPAQARAVEGTVHRHLYVVPQGTTSLEVFRNYQSALQSSGFKLLFACDPEQCGGTAGVAHGMHYQAAARQAGLDRIGRAQFSNTRAYYLVAEGGRPGEQLWVQVMIGEYSEGGTRGPAIFQTIVQPRAAKTGQVQVDASAMKDSLASAGKAVIYGLLFDTDSDVLKPESRPQIEQIARLLQANPGMKLLVVGHTDNQGALDYNVGLSQRRAAAVVKALVTGHGVDDKRLVARGVGMLAPVASNRAEDGRARNRRVEIVEQ